jgi:threonine synthase
MLEGVASASYALKCVWCEEAYASSSSALSCGKCGSALDTIYDYEALKSRFSGLPTVNSKIGVWRYSPLLPLTKRTTVITLGEGNTPLLRLQRIGEDLGMENLHAKDESRNPTCSFKDRKFTVALTKAVEDGYKAVASVTAGNAGSSVAAYCAKADVRAYIFTIEGIPLAKLAKLVSYGAKVFRTKKTTAELLSFANEVCKKYGFVNLSAASRYNPYVKEGAKTAVFEIFEQLGGQLPDWFVVPVGGGGNLAAYFKAVKELKELGLVDQYPKIVGVQGKYCAPVVEAFEKGLDPKDIPRVSNPRTIAHSILDDWTPDGDQTLTAIRKTKGIALGVTDKEILEASKLLSSKEALFVEPASAAPLAAVRQLVENGMMDRKDSVVIVATGFGLNQPDAAFEAWGTPPAVDLDLSTVAEYIH